MNSADRPGDAGTGRPEKPDADRPDETTAERDDRHLIELLQELRVAGLGVQVLFGFMLALPFTTGSSSSATRSASCTWPASCWPRFPRPC